MKHIKLFLFVFSFFSLNAQNCPPGDVMITSQQEMDDFAANFPNCTEIMGDVFVDGSISSLAGLSQLTTISGELRIENTNISNMMGLENLVSVSKLDMRYNDNLVNLTGLESLSSVNDYLRIIEHQDLTSLAGLENLTTISGYVEIKKNDALISLTGLNNVTSISGNLIISANRSMPNLAGLESLTSIGGLFILKGVDPYLGNESPTYVDLASIAELENLTSVGGLWITGTTALTNLIGLENLSTIGGYLRINDNNVLVDLTPLENLTSIDGDFKIEYNDALTALAAFENLTAIDGELKIIGNPVLTSLAGLENIDYTTITNLSLRVNSNLSACDLPNICTYLENGGAAYINNNTFGCMNQVEIEQACMDIPPGDCPIGNVTIDTQAQLDAFIANYPNCTTINGDLRIRSDISGANALTDISGLSMLTHISGDLRITEAFHLPSLDGLEQLEWIGGDLIFDFIWDRATPLNISALDHAITIDGIVYLGDIVAPFTQIEPCGVQAICDHYFLSPNNVVNVYGACGSLFQACQDPSADCPDGDVIISSQADMNYFAATYPNCTQINGNWIMDSPPYTYSWINIAELPALERITGTISIRTRTMLSANSFSALTQVDGGVYLSTEIEGDFPALESIGGSIVVFDGSNTGAGPTGGYPALRYIGGGISAGGPEGGFFNSNDFPLLERIEGSISGCGWDSSHDFSGFDNLRYIGGSINTQDGTISGMNMVDTIGGSINFQTCYAAYIPIQITGLNQLKYIGGNLKFNDKHCLQDISGLTQLNAIGGDLGIIWQSNFACSTSTDSLTGLGQLRHVGDDLSIFESNLSNLDFLSQLQSVGDSLYIRSNSFDNLDALNHPISIGGELIISQNWNLSECAVQAVCDHLADNQFYTIENNALGCNSSFEVQASCDPMLLCPSGDITLRTQAEIDGFFTVYTNCTELPGRLIISAENPADINSLEALSQLTSLGNGLIIDNTAITNLSGLQNLTTTGYNIVITNNSNLTSLEGLENISSTSSHLKIENNDALSDLSGLNNITQIGESLLIFDNDNLQNLSGLNALTSIGLQLYLKSNINMTSLSGLENLTSIGTDIRIQGNTSLGSLSALSNIANISGYIQLTNNDALTSLMGLENINPNGITQITVINNPNLSICSASSICGHVMDNGMTTFSNNATGCNSLSEVTDICTVSTHSPHDALNIAIFPNPNEGTFTIQGITNATYNIRSLTGQIIQTGELKNETSIDISSEAQGVYFISISIDNQVITKRIVKM